MVIEPQPTLLALEASLRYASIQFKSKFKEGTHARKAASGVFDGSSAKRNIWTFVAIYYGAPALGLMRFVKAAGTFFNLFFAEIKFFLKTTFHTE
jgi:hypothetical protein